MPKKSKVKSPIAPVLLLVGLALGFVVGGITKPDVPTLSSTEQEQPTTQTVTRVIDGDTVELSTGQSVRLTGVSAPGLKEKFSQEGKAFLEEKLLNQEVKLEYEKGYETDRFNRLNAYVFVGDENINELIIKQGLAEVVIYEKRRKLMYQDELLEAQVQAKKLKLNLWK
ncbi:thermonuclease family protein [Patescibacteria group bacterium]|nr:thermonuclease family protein [Patescibacteria group bacterium]